MWWLIILLLALEDFESIPACLGLQDEELGCSPFSESAFAQCWADLSNAVWGRSQALSQSCVKEEGLVHSWVKADPDFREGKQRKYREAGALTLPAMFRAGEKPFTPHFSSPYIENDQWLVSEEQAFFTRHNASALGRLKIAPCQLNECGVRGQGMQGGHGNWHLQPSPSSTTHHLWDLGKVPWFLPLWPCLSMEIMFSTLPATVKCQMRLGNVHCCACCTRLRGSREDSDYKSALPFLGELVWTSMCTTFCCCCYYLAGGRDTNYTFLHSLLPSMIP